MISIMGLIALGMTAPVLASKVHPVTIAAAHQAAGPRTITLVKGMAQVVNVPGAVADLMVANPSIVDVNALQSNKLYIVGVNYGTTNVIAVDASGNVISTFNVHVKIDDVAIQATVRKLFPDEDINVTAADTQIILTGHVSTPAVAQKVVDLVGQYTGEVQSKDTATADQLIVNLLTVAGEQQIMLKVKMIEADRNVLRELGLEVNSGLGTVGGAAAGGVVTSGINTAVASGLTQDALGIGSVIFDRNSKGVIGPIQLLIRALEQKGLVNTLAEPDLTAVSGEQAGFLAGGEFPIPTSRDQNNNIVVTYKPFGVALNFKPTVMSDNKISLQLQTEVSAIDSNHTLTSNGIVIPGFSVRRASTTVELGSGGSLMIAGLLQSNDSNTFRKVPGIGNIPILGALLSSQSFERDETELVVIVTAYLVNPSVDHKDIAIQAGPSAALADSGPVVLPPGAPLEAKPIGAAAPVAAATNTTTITTTKSIDLADVSPSTGDNISAPPMLAAPVETVETVNPLSRAFANNIHQTYAKVSLKPDLLNGDSGYGYLIK